MFYIMRKILKSVVYFSLMLVVVNVLPSYFKIIDTKRVPFFEFPLLHVSIHNVMLSEKSTDVMFICHSPGDSTLLQLRLELILGRALTCHRVKP